MNKYVMQYLGEYVGDVFARENTDDLYVSTAKERIVRCRDCEHAVVSHPLNPITGVWAGVELWGCRHFKDLCEPRLVRPDGFCAWGVRRAEQ